MTENKRFTCHQMISNYTTAEDIDFDFLQELIEEQEQPLDLRMYIADGNKTITYRECVNLLNELNEENQLLKEEKELLKNKLDRIEDILPHFLSCAEISEFRGKTVKEDIALMKCWNKRYLKH